MYGKEVEDLNAIWDQNEFLSDIVYDMEINKQVTVWTRFGYADIYLNQFDTQKIENDKKDEKPLSAEQEESKDTEKI